jgi:hypothetical protein
MSPTRQDPNLFKSAWRRAVPLILEGFRESSQKGQLLAGVPNSGPFYPGVELSQPGEMGILVFN